MEVVINYWALLIGVVVTIVLGSLWYGPLFGKPWVKLSGHQMGQKKGVGKSYLLMTIGTILMAYVLYHALVFGNYYLNMSGPSAGAMGAFWYWLGFVAPVTLGTVLWDGKPWKLWMINAGYYLVAMLLMGIIFASMMPVVTP